MPPPDLDSFIARWTSGDGGQERANYATFLSELCDVLDAPCPDPAFHDAARNPSFERAVTFREPDGVTRIAFAQTPANILATAKRRIANNATALWTAHRHMNESADFVMYWWDRAAELLTRKGTRLKRFGLVTTNSLSQVFQRRVMEKHLSAKHPISLLMAVPDHPWTKATKDEIKSR